MNDLKLVDFRSKRLPVPSVDDSGGPPYDGNMEARVAKVEAAVEHILSTLSDIKTDIREIRASLDAKVVLLGSMIIGTTLGLAGVMAKGFGWL